MVLLRSVVSLWPATVWVVGPPGAASTSLSWKCFPRQGNKSSLSTDLTSSILHLLEKVVSVVLILLI